jgi:hypothetical protein
MSLPRAGPKGRLHVLCSLQDGEFGNCDRHDRRRSALKNRTKDAPSNLPSIKDGAFGYRHENSLITRASDPGESPGQRYYVAIQRVRPKNGGRDGATTGGECRTVVIRRVIG